VNDKIKRATVGPLPGVTQDIAGYKVRPLGQDFFNISDSFVVLCGCYSFHIIAPRQRNTRRWSVLICLPHVLFLWAPVSYSSMILWTPFFLSLDINSICIRRYLLEKSCKTNECQSIKCNSWKCCPVMGKMSIALHFFYCISFPYMQFLYNDRTCSLLSICEMLGYVTCPLFHLVFCVRYQFILHSHFVQL
jgi:hypothetical protein